MKGRDQLKPRSLAEAAVKEATARGVGISVAQLAEVTGLPLPVLNSQVRNMVGTNQIVNAAGLGVTPALYMWRERTAALTQPHNGPGHTMHPLPVFDAPTNIPHRAGTAGGLYDGAELAPYTGRTDANDHMQHGSMVGGAWRPYTPPGLMCVGAAGPVPLGGAQRGRFAG